MSDSRAWAQHPGAGATILVVDDERDIVRMVTHILEGSGHEVVSAQNREQALEYIAHSRIDLVIVDLDLPLLSGRELALHIRTQPDTSKLPMVMMTALQVRLPEARTAFASGVDEYLFKPFMAETLLRNVARLLG